MGTSAALIQKQDVTTNQLSSLYWLNVIMGLLLFIGIAFVSPLVSAFFESPELLILIPFSASILFLQSFGQQYSILFRKELQFKTLESISLAIKMIDLIVVATLAYLGYGVWALVFAQIVSAISSSILFFILGKKKHLPSFRLKIEDLKPFFSFGLYQMGGQLVNYLNSNLDKIILGKFFGMEVLGFYNLAWQLIQYPKTRITPIISKITFPLFSKLQKQTAQLENYYSFSIRSLSLFIIPIYLFLGVFASDIVTLLFGPNWELTAQLVQILAGLGMLKTIANPGGSILLAIGRADVEFWWNIFWIITSSSVLIIGLQINPHIFTIAYILLFLNCFGSLIWHYLIHFYAKIAYKTILFTFFKSLLVSSLIILAIDFFSKSINFTVKANLFIKGIIYLVTYSFIMINAESEIYKKVLSFRT